MILMWDELKHRVGDRGDTMGMNVVGCSLTPEDPFLNFAAWKMQILNTEDWLVLKWYMFEHGVKPLANSLR